MHRDPLCSRAAGEIYFRSRVAVNLQNLTVFEAKPSMAMQQSRIASDHCVDGTACVATVEHVLCD
jgi:hypothetical protein